MNSLNRILLGGVLATIVTASITVFAHDGHNHGTTSQLRQPAVESRNDRSQQFRNDASRGSDTNNAPRQERSTGNCCSGTDGCSFDANAQTSPRDTFGHAATAASGPEQLDRLARSVWAALNVEMQGHRNYNSLRDDANDVLRTTQRLRQAEAARASSDVLLDEARPMLAPLLRMNETLANDPQAQRSYQAVRETGRVLLVWAREVQGLPASGAIPRSRTNDSIAPPQAPIPSRRQGVTIPDEMKGIALLSVDEQTAALRQRICPVTGEPLGSMGKPIRVTIAGRSMFVCCEGCVNSVKRNPEKYFSELSSNARTSPGDRNSSARPGGRSFRQNSAASIPAEMKGVALLPANDQAAALRQRTCPVNGEPLGSMGKPVKVFVEGRTVFVCCQGCVNAVKRNPEKYLK